MLHPEYSSSRDTNYNFTKEEINREIAEVRKAYEMYKSSTGDSTDNENSADEDSGKDGDGEDNPNN